MLITAHTAMILLIRRQAAWSTFWAANAFVCVVVAFLTFIGPAFTHNEGRTPFYCGSNEGTSLPIAQLVSSCEAGYCWISPLHSGMRLPLHFIWILLASFGSFIVYPLIFYRIRFRSRPEASVGLSSTGSFNKEIDRVAWRMLLFPITYLFNTISITSYRLATLDGHQASWKFLTAASCFYALSGVRVVVERMYPAHAQDSSATHYFTATCVAWFPTAVWRNANWLVQQAMLEFTSMVSLSRAVANRFSTSLE